MSRALLIAAGALALAGCASLPDGGAPVRVSQLAAQGSSPWAYDFGDPAFAAYLAHADIGSLDVKTALARARAADAALRAARAEGWPELSLGGGAGRTVPGQRRGRDQVDLDLTGRWTLDLWGEVRAASNAARAETRAAGLDVRTARAVLAAEAARGWLALSALDDRLSRLDARRAMEAEGLKLAERRLAAGRASRDETLERQANLARIADDRRAAEGERLVVRQRLIALAGSGSPTLGEPAPLARLAPLATAALDSAALDARPDVAAAAARLEAADARRLAMIRDARPRLIFTAGLRGDGETLSNLLQRRSLTLTPGVRLEGAVLDGGRAGARADKAAAEAAEAEAGYLKALIAAESELAASLAQMAAAADRQAPADAAIAYARQRLVLARARLAAGTASRLDLIDAERSLTEAQDAQAAARRSLIEASIVAQAALVGGGAGGDGAVR